MAYRQQLDHFRKEIRRNQLDQIFQARRIKLLTDCNEPMDAEEPLFLKKLHLDAHQLRSLARLSQTESGIEVINQANYGQCLIQYLSPEYVDADEQLYATYALCNLSYKSKTAPSTVLLSGCLQLLEESNSQHVADNILSILAHTMCDYQQTKAELVLRSIVDRIIAVLSRFENPAIFLCNAISNCILQLLNRTEPHISFKKLRPILLRLNKMGMTTQTMPVIKQSTFSLYLLAKMFPVDMADYIIKSGTFQRLTELYKQSSQVSLVSFMLKIANAILKQFKDNSFATLILPLLDYISFNDFQSIKTSGIHSRTLRIQTYKLIYAAFQMDRLKAQEFMGSQLGKRMLATFQVEDDSEVRRELVFAFTPVLVSSKNEVVRNALWKAMVRARELDHNNFQLVSHIDLLKSLNH